MSFLTIIRVPFARSILGPPELAASFSCFPLAGLVLGLVYSGTAMLLAGHVPPFVLSVFVCALMVVLTRGFHLDGLADLGDGFWGGSTPERRLEIMKDSRVGTFGVLALVLALAFKIASIDSLISTGKFTPLLLAPVFARFAMVAAAFGSNYARREGLGRPFLEHMRTGHLLFAALFCLAASLAAGPRQVFYFAPALAAVVLFRYFSQRLLGGITGDVFGATSETTEILILVLGACAP